MLRANNDEDGSVFNEETAKLNAIIRRKKVPVMLSGLYVPVWTDET